MIRAVPGQPLIAGFFECFDSSDYSKISIFGLAQHLFIEDDPVPDILVVQCTAVDSTSHALNRQAGPQTKVLHTLVLTTICSEASQTKVVSSAVHH